MTNLIKTETFELDTTNLQFHELQQYMAGMTQDWNWAKCNVITTPNKLIFVLFEEEEVND